MRRAMMLCAAVLCLTMTLAPTALAAGTNEVEICYPTAITQSEDGTELRKLYDLGPEDDPTGIPRSDFEQDGFHYTLTDLLRQELPEHDERQHTETVSLQSANKDMASILALLPQEKEFITEDGYMGTLSLQLDTVQVEVSGYGSSTREISATRSYPNLANQDTSNIPKTIQDNGRTLTLQTINWQTDNTATLDGYALGDRFTAVATYRQCYQQLCEGLHRHRRLYRHCWQNQSGPCPLCGHLRGHTPPAGGGSARSGGLQLGCAAGAHRHGGPGGCRGRGGAVHPAPPGTRAGGGE